MFTIDQAMPYLQLIGYIITVIYFVRSTKGIKKSKLEEEIEQINTINKLVEAVKALVKLHELEVEQRKATDNYAKETRLRLRLILQQHKANHNQEITGGD